MNSTNKWLLTDEEKDKFIATLTPNLTILRTSAEISQEELANLIGVSRQTYSAIERKVRKMAWSTYLSLVLFYDHNRKTHKLIRQLSIFPKELVIRFNDGVDYSDFEISSFLGNKSEEIIEHLDDQAKGAIRAMVACINNVDAKIREDVAIDILRKINASVINDGETIMVLTNAVNDCSVKELSKMDSAFLQRVCQIRAKVDKSGLEKIKAVFIGEMLTANNAQRKRPVNLSGELAQTGISLKSVEKSDYEAYIKNYFDEYFVLLQASEDVPALMRIFYHGRYFSNFIDDYISVLKKKAKKETERWKRILAWTCVYLVTAERSDQAAEELYKPIVRYLRSLDEDRLLDVRQAVIQDVPSSRCDYLFDEVRRKEGFVEKLGGFFHKK